MLVGRRAIKLTSLALFLSVPVAGQEPPPDPEADSELLVIARKMRKVRLNYTTRGSWVPRCDVAISSGDPRVDRIMCAVLRACVREGHREVMPAKTCMADRISQLADDGEPVAEIASPPPEADTAPVPLPSPPPSQSIPDIVVEGTPDIRVTGNVPALRGGLWLFRRSSTLAFAGGEPLRPFRFSKCLPDGTLEATLRRWGGEANALGALLNDMQCGNLRMTMAAGRIDARRSCSNLTVRQNHALTGRYDARKLTIDYRVEQYPYGIERSGSPNWKPQRPEAWRWRVTATRQDDCPRTTRAEQIDLNDAIHAMFSPKGMDEPGAPPRR